MKDLKEKLVITIECLKSLRTHYEVQAVDPGSWPRSEDVHARVHECLMCLLHALNTECRREEENEEETT